MWKIILIVVAYVAISRGAAIPKLETRTQQRLTAVLMESRAQFAANPAHSMDCFEEYVPKLNEKSNDYVRSYNKCLADAAHSTAYLEYEMFSARNNLTIQSWRTCDAYAECNTKTMAIDFFKCYADVAEVATKSSFVIDNTSTTNAGYMTNQYENITYERERCVDAAAVHYVEEVAKLYDALEACLALER